MYSVGTVVKVKSDNECYDSFRHHRLKITEVHVSEKTHRGYDNSMRGMALYDLHDLDTDSPCPCSLYEYELSKVRGGE